MTDANYSGDFDPDAYVPASSGGGVTIGVPRGPLSSLVSDQPATPPSPVAQLVQANGNAAPAQRGAIDKLLGLSGPRYELWPERLVRSALTAPGDAMTGQVQTMDSNNRGFPTDDEIQRVQDLAAVAGLGSVPRAALGETGTLGMAGGKAIQPELPAGEVFHSAVEHALANAPQDKMTGTQWLGWLKNQPGVKQDELDWLGFKPGSQSVSKSDMLTHAEGHGVGLQEIEKAGVPLSDESIGDRAAEIMEENHPDLTPEHAEYYDNYDDALSVAEEELRSGANEGAGAPKYSEYQLPGGDNYRELLLTMPNRGRKYVLGGLNDAGNVVVKNRFTGEVAHEGTPQSAQEYLRKHNADAPGDYLSSHWDEYNVLVHMRMNDRTLDAPTQGQLSDIGQRIAKSVGASKPEYVGSGAPTQAVARGAISPEEAASYSQARGFNNEFSNQKGLGLKSLHLEEVQSDWHQAGRKNGYAMGAAEREQLRQEINQEEKNLAIALKQREATHPDFDSLRDAWPDELTQRYRELTTKNAKADGVPDAPFKATWADLALKRAIAKAAREGYDAISWTPGEQQAERYDLSKQVQSIDVKPMPQTKRLGKQTQVTVNAHSGVHASALVGADGKVLEGYDAFRGQEGKNLADLVGKDVAERILGADKETKLEGDGLKVGGEGMKAFYDKMLVAKANAIGKKFGAKVEYKDLPQTHDASNNPPFQDRDRALQVLKHGGEIYAFGSRSGGEHHITSQGALEEFENNFSGPYHYVLGDRQPPLKVPVLRLTPQLKDTALHKGFPLFMHGSPFMFTPVQRKDQK